MKLWVDDVRPAPEGYYWVRSVNEAKLEIECFETEEDEPFELIDIGYDAGTFAITGGGDYIRVLEWLEETGRNYPIRIHSANAVGVANMRRIIQRNGWKEIK